MKPDKLSCPHCHASLSLATLRSNESTECPFCERDVSVVLAEWEESPGVAGPNTGEPGASEGLHRHLPPGSRLQIVEANTHRIRLLVPGGWDSPRSRRIGVFVLALFSPFGVALWVNTGFLSPDRSLLNAVVTLPAALVCPALLYALFQNNVSNWFRQVGITLEPETLTFETRLFGRENRVELPVTADTACSLSIIDSSDPRDPRHEVLVRDREQKFLLNNCLEDADQVWIVEQINAWVAAQVQAATRPAMVVHRREAPPPARSSANQPTNPPQDTRVLSWDTIVLEQTPESKGFTLRLLQSTDQRPDSEVRILEETPEALSFSFPLRLAPALSIGLWFSVVLFSIPALLTFSSPWIANRFWIGLIELLPSLGFALLLLYHALGSGIVWLTRDTLDCEWSCCGLRFHSRMPVNSIHGIRIGNLIVFRRAGEVHRPLPGDPLSPGNGCRIVRKNGSFALVEGCHVSVACDILGLILGRLHLWEVLRITPLPQQGAAGISSRGDADGPGGSETAGA